MLDKGPLSDPGRGPPSCNRLIQILLLPPSGCRVRQIWLLWPLDTGLPVRSLLVFSFSGFLAKKTRFPLWFIGGVLHVLYFIMYFFFFSFSVIVSSLGFSGGSVSKESACNVEDLSSVPGSGRSPWRKKRQPTPVFLLGKSHGQRSLVGYRPWGHKELYTTE